MPNDEYSGLSRQLRGDGNGAPAPAAPAPVPAFDPNLNDMIIDQVTSDSIRLVLTQLVRDSHASGGMVLDRAGQIIVWDGSGYRDESMQLGALIAGTYASTRQMARILGENNFRTLLQEGAREKIFTEAVGEYWLVSVIFDRHTHLGLVKVICNRATVDLGAVLLRSIEMNRSRPRGLDAALQRVTRDTIDLIFREEPEK